MLVLSCLMQKQCSSEAKDRLFSTNLVENYQKPTEERTPVDKTTVAQEVCYWKLKYANIAFLFLNRGIP